MSDVVIVEAVRSPLGRRKGGLSGTHSVELLAAVQSELFKRSGVDPASVGQVVGGCVGQVGMQTMNVTRQAWLTAGLPLEVAATTVDTQCGSSQQATNLAYALVKSGMVDSAVGCGVELMSRVPMGATIPKEPKVGKPVTKAYWQHHEFTSQFQGADLIAKQWGITREETDAFGALSQKRAAEAWADDRFSSQILPIEAPELDEDRKPPDGAAAVLMMTREKAESLGLTPKATIVDGCLVGSDPALMLTGPIGATQKLLGDNGMQMSDIDVVEINEAFASVVLAWERELSPDMATVNPNGGAIALGHPLGGTGAVLLTKAIHELERANKEHAIVTMCCGGGLGTGTLLRRG